MFSWHSALITFLICWHLKIVTHTIYVHRGQGHHYFTFSPVLEHFFRFCGWFLAGSHWENWQKHYAALHRMHHAYSDTELDPHSPYHYTFSELLDVTGTKSHYVSPEDIEKYAPDIISTNDWLARNLYGKYPNLGLLTFWLIFTILFGVVGVILGCLPYFFGKKVSIILGDYMPHKIGFSYAGNKKSDRSMIFSPIGIFLVGEDLHAHHHNDDSIPYFSRNWWEFDLGWFYCRILMALGLMTLNDRTSWIDIGKS